MKTEEQAAFQHMLEESVTHLKKHLTRRAAAHTTNTGRSTLITERITNTMQTPEWLGRVLLRIGIHTEHTANMLTANGWFEAQDTAEPPPLADVANKGGGIFRSLLNLTQEEVKQFAMGLLQTTHTANDQHKILRYVIIAQGGTQMQQYLKSNGGKIMATWAKGTMRLNPTANIFTHTPTVTKLNDEPIVLVLWETALLDVSWGIPDEFWQLLLHENHREGNGLPDLRESRGWTKQMSRQMDCNKGKAVIRSQPLRWVWHPQWEELANLEKTDPQLFWASRVPQLRSQPDFGRPEVGSCGPKASVTITVKVGDEIVSKAMPIDPLKLPDNADKKRAHKQACKEAKRQTLQWYADLEMDIWTQRRELHILQGRLLGHHNQQATHKNNPPHGRKLQYLPKQAGKHSLQNGQDGPISKRQKLNKSAVDKGTVRKRVRQENTTQPNPIAKVRRLRETVQLELGQAPSRPHPKAESSASRDARVKLERFRYQGPQARKRTHAQIVILLESYKYQKPTKRRRPP